MFERVADHVTRGLALLPDQFQKPHLRALLTSWLDEFQEAEDALWQILDAGLDDAAGARLAQWAALLGEPVGDLDDEALRKVARGRIRANRSMGRDADFAALLAIFATLVSVDDFAPASVLVTLYEFPGEGLPARIASLVRRAVGGGIGVQTVSFAVDALPFRFASQSEEVETNALFGLADDDQTQGGALCGVW